MFTIKILVNLGQLLTSGHIYRERNLNSLLRSQHVDSTQFEDDHNIYGAPLQCNASNVVVLICIITWQHVGVPVLHQSTSLLLGPPWVVVAAPLGTALVKESAALVVLWLSLVSSCPTIVRLNRT